MRFAVAREKWYKSYKFSNGIIRKDSPKYNRDLYISTVWSEGDTSIIFIRDPKVYTRCLIWEFKTCFQQIHFEVFQRVDHLYVFRKVDTFITILTCLVFHAKWLLISPGRRHERGRWTNTLADYKLIIDCGPCTCECVQT